MTQKNIAVIGGGAAGMLAAITAAKTGAKVTLYERNDRVGKKLLATGNGKCNFANRQLSVKHYFGGDTELISRVLKRFDAENVVSFFESAGMMVKDKKGYLYPASEQAVTVLDILRIQLEKYGVHVICEQKISKILSRAQKDKFVIKFKDKETEYNKIVLACGGTAAPKTGSDGTGFYLAKELGHTIVPVVPALVQLRCAEQYLKEIAGVRADAGIRLFVNGAEQMCERGELQLTDYGVSGIVVFQLSRMAAYALLEKQSVSVYIDLLPDYTKEDYKKFVTKRMADMGHKQTVEEFFTGMLNKKLMLLFIKLAGLQPGENAESADRKKLEQVFSLCREFRLTVNGTNSFEQAQVSAGGVKLSEVTDNLESKLHKGLFFAGEILDVDGKCGGYNLQWAWSSGYVAGKSAAE